MSDPLDPNSPTSPEASEELSPSPRLVSGSRRSSVKLRARGTDENLPELDVANKSVSEALELAFGVVKIAMGVLIVLFLLSGFQTVKENESGVRLLFGKVQGDRLPPGFRASYPYPLGELVKISTSSETMDLNEDFWPFISGNDSADVEKLSATSSLEPGNDGSLITGDQALAHALLSVTYRRENIVDYAENIQPFDEDLIVQYILRRAMVQAAAEMTVDDLVKQQAATDTDSMSLKVQLLAQQQLDALDSGIHIDRLAISQTMVPVAVRDAFTQVLNASSKASGAAVKAENEASRLLAEVAGDAGHLLVEQIRLYEEATERADQPAQEETLIRIFALLEGKPVTIDGELVEARVAGEVTEILSRAERYRTSRRNEMRAEADRFTTKLAQFQSNPSVAIQLDWADAYKTFVDRDSVQLTYFPMTSGVIELLINEDPQMTKLQRQLQDQRRNQDAWNERDKMQKYRDYTTTETILTDSE